MTRAGLWDSGAIEGLVLDTLAATCRCDRHSIDARTLLLDLNLDSLTLIAVLTRIEAAIGIAFSGDEAAHMLGARDVGDLCRAVTRKALHDKNVDERA